MIIQYESLEKEVPTFAAENFEAWVRKISLSHNKPIKEITYVFSSDAKVLEINQNFLDHDFYTDIITFDNTENVEEGIESDIFISVDRVKENAEEFEKGNFARELMRVMAHGVLHLMGFGDKTKDEEKEMRMQESMALDFIENYVSRETN